MIDCCVFKIAQEWMWRSIGQSPPEHPTRALSRRVSALTGRRQRGTHVMIMPIEGSGETI